MADETLTSPVTAAAADADEFLDADDPIPVTPNGTIPVDAPAEDDRVPKLEAAKAALERETCLLRDEIRALEAERSGLQRDLNDAKDGAARAEAELKAVAGRADLLEGHLRLTQDDLASANIAASESEDRALALEREVKVLESAKADLEAKVSGLESKVKDVEEEVMHSKVGRRLAEDRAKLLITKGEELTAKLKDLEERNAKLEAQIGELQVVQEAHRVASSCNDSRVLWATGGVVAAATAVVGVLYLRHLKQ